MTGTTGAGSDLMNPLNPISPIYVGNDYSSSSSSDSCSGGYDSGSSSDSGGSCGTINTGCLRAVFLFCSEK